MNQNIKIKNEQHCTTIDIEGTIGLSEEWQFENPESRIATYERFRESVSQIADIQNSHIVVNIRSTGGDVNDAILIYEALRATGAHVTTRCYGYTASAATIVAQAASAGSRLIAPSSLYLIHNSLCSTEGNAEELQAEVEMLKQTDMRIAEIYATRSGRDVEAIVALMSENGGRGRWLAPSEAIEAGLVDAIIEEATTVEPTSLGERAKQGVKALLRAIGIESKDADMADQSRDINYIPRDATEDKALPVASSDASTLAFVEGQRQAQPTKLKSVEDPSLADRATDPRLEAYERDARSMRSR
jgi:ATP-dependent protease ClpP protease subunit